MKITILILSVLLTGCPRKPVKPSKPTITLGVMCAGGPGEFYNPATAVCEKAPVR